MLWRRVSYPRGWRPTTEHWIPWRAVVSIGQPSRTVSRSRHTSSGRAAAPPRASGTSARSRPMRRRAAGRGGRGATSAARPRQPLAERRPRTRGP
eukprot:4474888-Pyramimonas_sp.AAC.1